ncbi:hypothetical protein FOMG_18888 [Fusarium oxysporum f. sp. melonis 26406]|uniref:Major facilitator superfamily (MFS) profile domain-containing protein n=1 Tax=Fusarium oxysporum f. sp. melonis 26406 TaxID=1089452 RepID=W9ZTF6_FUSOX|nr:hypothetical protein FOMG_18888 [Fusarium oxysporum f. sp. melonis 26406]
MLSCITQDVVGEPQARCPCSTPQTWEQDLQLMHHFSTSAYLTLIDHSSLHQFWQVTVPAIAFSFDFLLHGILAFSALHLAHLRPNETDAWTILSRRHQSVAVTSFSSRLDDITNENVDPCLLYSCFVFMLETYSITTSSTAVLPRDISRSFILLQGVKGILSTAPGRWSSDGVLAPLMRRAVEPVFIPSKGFKVQIETLREMALPSEVTHIHRNALDGLLTTFEAVAASQSGYGHVWLWAITLPRAFLELVSENEPFALVILAHYATLVRCFEHDRWYIQGWSARVLAAVQDALLESWKPWLDWPVQCIQSGLDQCSSSLASSSGFGLVFVNSYAPMLIVELAHPKDRQVITSLYQTCWYLGAVASASTTFGTFAIPNDWAWRIPSYLQAAPASVQIVAIWFLPESPRFMIAKGRPEQAKAF